MQKKRQCNYKICTLASDNQKQLMVHPQDKPAAVKKNHLIENTAYGSST